MPTTKTRTRPRGGTSRATAHTAQQPSKRARPSPPGRAGPINEWLELRRSPIHGLGGFARRDIPTGTRIIEYTGEKISNSEADRRYDDEAMKRHHTFLFVLNSRTCVDAAFEGNEARFLNHSCAPNCEAVIERGHIWIDALTDISAGSELLYDYQYEDDPEYTQDDLRFYACHCGAPNCRGTIVKTRRRVRPAATP
ncbi:MAG TPA: SET domain-containing protein-lysine N-methyltransferase [Gemmatimonadaceae bacterium]|nr:SET domain-containing protein-lysine N-methyltransferase [Gemmatimonadaceae bacterium]